MNAFHNKQRDTYYQSIDGTLVPSPSSITTPHHSFVGGDEEKMYPMPSLISLEKKIHDFGRKNSTKLLEDNDTAIESLEVKINDNISEFPKLAISKVKDEK